MKFSIQYLSFFVIQAENAETDSAKRFKHYQTLGHEEYQDSELKTFLDGEFSRIGKRKAEVNPAAEQVPTKIGRFAVEPGFDPTSNPNYNLFNRLRAAADKRQFHACSDELIRLYMDASAVRGGALVVASARINELFDEPFIFVLKCDFETQIARISDEKNLISRVEMAINARNIKSIQYPHMPEPGMLEEMELKIHQASHARYFEDFLKYVSYEKSKPAIAAEQVMGMVTQFMEHKWSEAASGEDASLQDMREQEMREFEVWAAADKRELQEKWTHEHVSEAAAQLVEFQPELDLKFKLGGVTVRGKMADYGGVIHLARMNGRYVALIEGDAFEFDRGVSPVELLHPEDIETVLQRMNEQRERPPADETNVPWDE
jgi:hypothetical protein